MLHCVILMGFMEEFIIVGKKQLVCVDLCCCQGLTVLESIDRYQIASLDLRRRNDFHHDCSLISGCIFQITVG